MFDKLKNLLSTKQNIIVNIPQVEFQNEIYSLFIEQSKELIVHESFPLKAKQHLDSLIQNLKNIDNNILSIEHQARIERILSKEIPQIVEVYFSLPKAHAVSVVLDNGKTAKQIFIEEFLSCSNRISEFWNDAVQIQSKNLINHQNLKNKLNQPKKDFFDL
jgi:hypothetical protein